MRVEDLMERELARETEVLGRNIAQCHFIHYKTHITGTRIELVLPRWEIGN
jgi:hypothetical protein